MTLNFCAMHGVESVISLLVSRSFRLLLSAQFFVDMAGQELLPSQELDYRDYHGPLEYSADEDDDETQVS